MTQSLNTKLARWRQTNILVAWEFLGTCHFSTYISYDTDGLRSILLSINSLKSIYYINLTNKERNSLCKHVLLHVLRHGSETARVAFVPSDLRHKHIVHVCTQTYCSVVILRVSIAWHQWANDNTAWPMKPRPYLWYLY